MSTSEHSMTTTEPQPLGRSRQTGLRARSRARRVAFVLAFGFLGSLLLPGSGTALAARSHAFSFAMGKAGGGAGEMSLASSAAGSGVAVDDSSHDVYVADTGNRRVDEFDPSQPAGEQFVRAWGWGVATGAAELQVCNSECRPGLSGSQPGEFETPSYVSVDNGAESASKGDVYVGDRANDLVTKFDGEGHLISSWGNNGAGESPNGQLKGSPTESFDSGFAELPIEGVTADESGDLWVYNLHARLFEFKSDGTWTSTCTTAIGAGPGAGGITTHGSSIYVHDGGALVHELGPACSDAGLITSPPAFAEGAEGVAVDANGDFYVAREGISVEDIPGSCVPSEIGCTASQVFGDRGELSAASGVGVDPASGFVFVADAATNTVSAFALALEATKGAASGVTAAEATLHGTVNPEGTELVSCEFEYGPTVAYGSQQPCSENPETIGKGSSPVSVAGAVAGLSGGTTYHFRLHARSATANVYGEDGSFTTQATAVVREVSSESSAAGAVLKAIVNPAGLAASYHFEFGPCAAPGSCVGSPFPQRAPEPEGELAAGSSDVAVSQPIEGLTAGLTYHFRIVVTDANGEALPTPEGTFVLGSPAQACATERPLLDGHLADCRAYELVSPPDKNGALLDNGVFLEPPSIAADGSRVFTQSLQCFGDSPSCTAVRQTEGSTYSFMRTGAGWQAESLLPDASANTSVLGFSATAGGVLLARSAEPPALEQLYVSGPGGTLHTIGPVAETPGAHIGEIAGFPRTATGDFSHVVYQGPGLWPALEGGTASHQVYAYPGPVSGQPMLVGVSGGAGSQSLIGTCGTELGGNKLIHSDYGSLSSDGRTIFFTVNPCSTGTGANAGREVPAYTLYERVVDANGGTRTVLVSGPAPEDACDAQCQKAPARAASFEGASVDGSRVFFTDTGRLTNDAGEDVHSGDNPLSVNGCAHTAPSSSGCNLYAFVCPAHCENAGERELVDASAGDVSGLGPQVRHVVAIPPDGSEVFFVAHGVLTGANKAGKSPSPGAENLYVYRLRADGREGGPVFIATLSAADQADCGGGIECANVTSDGRFLVFTSHRALTADVSREEGSAQVYRYDVEAQRLSRVSIGQAGYGDNGNAGRGDAQIVRGDQGFEDGVGPASADPTMSDDGQLVFFESPTALTPGALNDQGVIGNPNAFAENVYEWAAEGAKPSPYAPACGEANGCVSLISDGRDLNEGTDAHGNQSAVQLLGVDATGQNVFFWTADQLLPADTDSQVDLYDARVGGGFPEAPPPEPCLSVTACHAEAPPPPAFPALQSTGLPAFGNAVGGIEETTQPPAKLQRSSPAERLAKALAACRKKHGRARASCESGARAGYRAQLLATALRSCRERHAGARAACERHARKRYAKPMQRGRR